MEEMKIYETELGWKKTEFDTTPLMSTYILVYIIKLFVITLSNIPTKY